MIHLSPAAWRILTSGTYSLRRRVKWSIGRGVGSVDVSDRIVTISPPTRATGLFLSPFQTSECMINLRNDDGIFTSRNQNGYFPAGPTDYYLTKISYELGVPFEDGTVEYFPVYAGRVRYTDNVRGNVEVKVQDNLSIVSSKALPTDYTITSVDGSNNATPADHIIEDILTKFTYLTTADIDTTGATYQHALGHNNASGWFLGGTFQQGTTVREAIDSVARSVLATIVVLEDGRISAVSELPKNLYSFKSPIAQIPDEVTRREGFEWNVIESLDSYANEVVAGYAGVRVSSPRNLQYESQLGRTPKNVTMPNVLSGAVARWACRLLRASADNLPPVVQFSLPGFGHVIQLNDRIRVRDPETDTPRILRVLGKVSEWPFAAFVGVDLGHETSVINATVSSWGTTNYPLATL